MTNEELCELIKAGHVEYKEDLIKQNINFIRANANFLFFHSFFKDKILGLDVEDLIQDGCIKLLESVDLYDPSRGNLFLTFAGRNVINNMTDTIRAAKSTAEGRLVYEATYGLIEQRIDEIIHTEEGRIRLADALVNPLDDATDYAAIKHFEGEELYKAMDECSARSSTFIKFHFGFDDEIAHRFEDSMERFGMKYASVQKLYNESMDEIREKFSFYSR